VAESEKDGTDFTTSASINVIEFQGQPHFLCVQHDVTQARLTQEALAESRMRLDLATQAAEIGVWDWDVQTDQMVYSERAKAICGFPPGAPVTFKQVRDATHPDDLPHTSAQARRALDPALRDRSPYEYRIVRPDGTIRWVIAHGQAIFPEESGSATRYVGTIQDITERKQTAQALQDSENRLKLALHAGRLAVWEYRAATDSVVGSPELYAFLGFPADREVPLAELRSRYAPGQQEALRAAGRAALERGDTFMEAEVRYELPGGVDRWALLRADFIFPPGATAPDVLGVLVDITERKQAEDNLRLLVDELNHRVKNTLAVVQSISAQTFSEAADPGDAHRRFQSRIQALAGAHDILTARYWVEADLAEVVAASLRPHVARRVLGCLRRGRSSLSPRGLRCRWPWFCMNWQPTP
jgi:PAS domain S-box-containing protein